MFSFCNLFTFLEETSVFRIKNCLILSKFRTSCSFYRLAPFSISIKSLTRSFFLTFLYSFSRRTLLSFFLSYRRLYLLNLFAFFFYLYPVNVRTTHTICSSPNIHQLSSCRRFSLYKSRFINPFSLHSSTSTVLFLRSKLSIQACVHGMNTRDHIETLALIYTHARTHPSLRTHKHMFAFMHPHTKANT